MCALGINLLTVLYSVTIEFNFLQEVMAFQSVLAAYFTKFLVLLHFKYLHVSDNVNKLHRCDVEVITGVQILVPILFHNLST